MPMMKCGCAAQGTCAKEGGAGGRVFDPPVPVCITHQCFEVADEGDAFKGRTARCAYHGKQASRSECRKCRNGQPCACEEPSSADLAFFVFEGEGSRTATEICKCGMHRDAHGKGYANCKCREFRPQGPKLHDRYYCGCHSWD